MIASARRQPSDTKTTKLLRVPVSMVSDIRPFATTCRVKLPLFTSRVQAGPPSPADSHVDETVDLNTLLIKHPTKTFLVRANGESMRDAGIHNGDLLVVDSSIKPANGKIIIAAVDGELTVKFYQRKKDKIHLVPANPDFKAIIVEEGNIYVFWGSDEFDSGILITQ